MSFRMNREGYEKLIQDDLEWLLKQPRTLERGHIKLVLEWSVDKYYGPKNRTFKVVARNKPKEEMGRFNFGDPNRVVKKRMYKSLEDFERYSPKLIEGYLRNYIVEVYELINDKWVVYENI